LETHGTHFPFKRDGKFADYREYAPHKGELRPGVKERLQKLYDIPTTFCVRNKWSIQPGVKFDEAIVSSIPIPDLTVDTPEHRRRRLNLLDSPKLSMLAGALGFRSRQGTGNGRALTVGEFVDYLVSSFQSLRSFIQLIDLPHYPGAASFCSATKE
jgi:hypothetical protein